MVRGSIQQEDLIFVTVCMPKRFRKCRSETERRKRIVGKFTIMYGDFFLPSIFQLYIEQTGKKSVRI